MKENIIEGTEENSKCPQENKRMKSRIYRKFGRKGPKIKLGLVNSKTLQFHKNEPLWSTVDIKEQTSSRR